MRLEGIHHITCITADAPANVEFYAGTLGLRLVKKTVNQDDPTVYHLFYADERGSAGSDITSSSTRGRGVAAPARGWCTGSSGASAPRRRSTSGRSGSRASQRGGGQPRFSDPEGLDLELVVSDAATHRSSPTIRRSRPSSPCRDSTPFASTPTTPSGAAPFLEAALDFRAVGENAFECRGDERGSIYAYD